MKSVTSKYRYRLWGKESTVISHAFCLGKRDLNSGVCKSLVLLRVAWQTDRHIRTVIWRTEGGFVTNGRRGVRHKHVTVSGTVKVCAARPHIATIPVTDSNCTGDNSTKFVMMDEKHLLICTETIRIVVRKQTGLSWVLLSTGRFSIFI